MNSVVKRGRPAKQKLTIEFDSSSIKLFRGNELSFSDELFKPMTTGTELDVIFSTEGGLMPGTNMMLAGGPGSGKSTIVLDVLSKLTLQGLKVLFVSGEMDEIGHFKYCKRMPGFKVVPTLFLKNYTETVKETMEYVFDQGYDVIAIDSIAEVIEMYKDTYRTTESAAELWFLNLQCIVKKGGNKLKKYTSFINIQQVTKAGDFAGSNRLKHMTEAMCHIDRIKGSDSRKIYFSKNRDCDTESYIKYRIEFSKVEYSLPEADEEE